MTTRLYIGPYSRMAHLVVWVNVYSVGMTACGKSTDMWWLGTGSQAEYDRAAMLPLCAKCEPSNDLGYERALREAAACRNPEHVADASGRRIVDSAQ